jgi:hypothetical protein
MKKLTFIIILCICLAALGSTAQQTRLTSPNGNIGFSFTADENGLTYGVKFKKPTDNNQFANKSFFS